MWCNFIFKMLLVHIILNMTILMMMMMVTYCLWETNTEAQCQCAKLIGWYIYMHIILLLGKANFPNWSDGIGMEKGWSMRVIGRCVTQQVQVKVKHIAEPCLIFCMLWLTQKSKGLNQDSRPFNKSAQTMVIGWYDVVMPEMVQPVFIF